MGQLAAGMGHELRNPLGAIKNAAYFLKMAVEEPKPEVKETLEILEKEVTTSERIISSLLGFAHPKPPTGRKVNINEFVQEALSCAALPENVEVVSQLDGALPAIMADPDQLGQIFGNIILNAIQAMPDGGQLMVKTSAGSVEPSEAHNPQWVAISFADTGVGIPEESLGRLFEPFFTTKAKGIGLGLALSKTLTKGHGGTIQIQSEVGKGSIFTVMLPVSSISDLGLRIKEEKSLVRSTSKKTQTRRTKSETNRNIGVNVRGMSVKSQHSHRQIAKH